MCHTYQFFSNFFAFCLLVCWCIRKNCLPL
nr:MAG TPA: hypothetical protein [Caudoviricetes sp.]